MVDPFPFDPLGLMQRMFAPIPVESAPVMRDNAQKINSPQIESTAIDKQVNVINIQGSTAHPAIEQKILEDVGSYGRQLGVVSEALYALVKRMDIKSFHDEKDQLALLELKDQVEKILRIKDAWILKD